MATNLDLTPWRESPRGVGYRRWAIVATGLRDLFRAKLPMLLLTVGWSGGVLLAIVGFLLTQSISSGGWLETLASNFGARAEATVTVLGGFIALYPDVCIGGLFTLLFWLHSFLGLGLSLVALTVLVPRLIARDRASNALTVYLSRPLTSGDYLLGKLGMIVGVLLLMWTGPLVLGWTLSMLLAPDRDFIVYSFGPFLHALAFNGIALVVLAAAALGVSALNRVASSAVAAWILLWIVAGAVANIPKCPVELQRVSFSRNLSEVRQQVFRLDRALTDAATKLPLLGDDTTRNLKQSGDKVRATDFDGALASLGILTLLSSAVFLRKLRPE